MSKALIVVDFQRDFCPGGTLAVPHGDQIADTVNYLVEEYPHSIATRDWHPQNHSSFFEYGGTWPSHCVMGTRGAAFHESFHWEACDIYISKGTEVDKEAYSGFEGTDLDNCLKANRVNEVGIVGLAAEYCVYHTAKDALRLGYHTTVYLEGIRGIALEDAEHALLELQLLGATIL